MKMISFLSLLKQVQRLIPMSKDIMFTKIYGSQLWTRNLKPKWSLIMWWIKIRCLRLKEHFYSRILPLGKTGKFAKMIFYFLRADQDAECRFVITGIKVNLNDEDGTQVPGKLKISGPKNLVEILCKTIQRSTKEGK